MFKDTWYSSECANTHFKWESTCQNTCLFWVTGAFLIEIFEKEFTSEVKHLSFSSDCIIVLRREGGHIPCCHRMGLEHLSPDIQIPCSVSDGYDLCFLFKAKWHEKPVIFRDSGLGSLMLKLCTRALYSDKYHHDEEPDRCPQCMVKPCASAQDLCLREHRCVVQTNLWATRHAHQRVCTLQMCVGVSRCRYSLLAQT